MSTGASSAAAQVRQPRQRWLAVFGVGSAVVYFAALATGTPGLRLAAKPVPALVLAAWVLAGGGSRLRAPVASGLLVSAVGDALLELGLFLPGLLAFLAAHLSYLAGFVRDETRPALVRALPFVAWGVGAFVVLRPGLGPMAVPVAVYVAVICTMMWRAAARVGTAPARDASGWLGLAGAIAFGASDTLIAFDRFRAPVPGAAWPVMALYWLGQSGIAAAAVRLRYAARRVNEP